MIITDVDLLRVDCEDVKIDEIDSIRASLEKEMRFSYEMGRPGLGLAAPQIGIPKKMAIIRLVSNSGSKFDIDLINCKIEKSYNEFIFDNEGCLSFPNLNFKTKRFEEIYIVNNLVEPYSFIATGLLSVCIQHELDHLNKILLTDRAVP